jgi:DNA-binding transcriptional ArsR family regulator
MQKWSLSETASLISDPGRASMLMSLLGGVTLPAGQLAMIANVAPQTASSHLSRLVAGQLLAVEQQGRHRYYRLSSSEVAHAIEALLAATPSRTKREGAGLALMSHAHESLSFARTCYSHLAGRLAVQIVASFEARGYLVPCEPRQYEVSTRGRSWFQEFGIALHGSQLKHPRFARRCLDWTERRPHIAGHLGCAMLARLRELKWLAPIRGSRALRLTLEGQQGFEKLLGLRFANGGRT